MLKQFVSKRYFPFCLFLFSLLVYLFYAQGISIYILDEAKNAECAREMLEQRNFFVPTFNYVLRTDKPPLHYFFMMLSYSIFGVNPFAARFFSAVFGALTVLVTFIFTRKFAGVQTAFYTVICLLASIHLVAQFHLAVPDPYLIFFFTASLFLFYAALKTRKWQYTVLMYVSIGLGALAKGPVAILLPGLIYLLFLIFSKQFLVKNILSLKPFWGILIVLAIAAPWYIVNGLQTDGEWTRGFFMEHNIGRFSGEMEGHGGFFLLPFLFVIAGLLPFAVFFPQVAKNAFKNRKDHFILFCLIAALTVVIFFSISRTKLINYTAPSYPFFAVLLGSYWAKQEEVFKSLKISFWILFFIAISIPIGGFVLLETISSQRDLGVSVLFLSVFPLGLFIAWMFRKHIHKFLIAIAVSAIVTVGVAISVIFPVLDKQNPVYKSLDIVKNRPLVYYKKFDPAYPFYLKKEIKEIDRENFAAFFDRHPDGIIISAKRKIKDVELPDNCKVIFSSKNPFENNTTVLISKSNN